MSTVGAFSGSVEARISPSASSFSPNRVSSAVPPMSRMKSQTHSPARFTSSRCAGTALTDGIAMNSLSSARQVSSTARDSTQIVRAAAEGCGLVAGVEEAAGLQREAAAADARRQSRANRIEGRDPLVELRGPAARQPLPVAFRRLRVRERVERRADPLERDARGLAGLHERDAPQRHTWVAALVPVGAPRGDQPLALVEAQRRLRDAAARGELADRQFTRHLT